MVSTMACLMRPPRSRLCLSVARWSRTSWRGSSTRCPVPDAASRSLSSSHCAYLQGSAWKRWCGRFGMKDSEHRSWAQTRCSDIEQLRPGLNVKLHDPHPCIGIEVAVDFLEGVEEVGHGFEPLGLRLSRVHRAEAF